jgi:hypothetical protein
MIMIIPTTATRKNPPSKINRDKIVRREIDQMILRDTEDYEIEDDRDEEVAKCLREAALKSQAYTRDWYNAVTDSFLHIPTLAGPIMDFSLIEIAEELCEEERRKSHRTKRRELPGNM